MNQSLFEHLDPLAMDVVVKVAMERGIDMLLDYRVTKAIANKIAIGQRVKVPLGRNNKAAFGFVVEITSKSKYNDLKAV